MNLEQLDRRIEEIEQELLRNDPALDTQFAQLDPAHRRHDATVLALAAASAVLVMVALATMSIAAWLAAAISTFTVFTIDTRHERKMRDIRRATELGLRPRRRRDDRQPRRRRTR